MTRPTSSSSSYRDVSKQLIKISIHFPGNKSLQINACNNIYNSDSQLSFATKTGTTRVSEWVAMGHQNIFKRAVLNVKKHKKLSVLQYIMMKTRNMSTF